MATNLPDQNISSFMAQVAREQTPSNWIWRVGEWFRSGPGMWLFIAAIIVALVGPVVLPKMLGGIIESAVGLTIVPVLVGVFVVMFGQRPPGYWRRYSLFKCMGRYPELGKKAYAYVKNLGTQAPFDYEIAVLEQNGTFFCAVLFQVMPRVVPRVSEPEGTPVAVFSGKAEQIEFSRPVPNPMF
jgi:hypothetical protein